MSTERSTMGGQFLYRSMTPDDAEQVREMYYEFWRRETIATALKMEIPRGCEKYVEFALKEVLFNEVSVVAEDRRNGMLVGMNTAVVATPENQHKWEYPSDDPDCQIMIQQQRIMSKVYTCPDYFKQYNVDKYLLSRGLVVREGYGHRNVGLDLCEKTREISRKLGIPFGLVDITNPFSRRIVEKLGFTQISQIDPADYIEESLCLQDNPPSLITLHTLYL